MTDDLAVRRGGEHDLPGILELARRALGWVDDDESFLRWKHLENPFGVSPMWVALDGARIVGFRTFLRWEFVTPAGDVVHAARAVDTATDPDYQGRGIFTRLTLEAIEQLPADGVTLIFNTPNKKSLPGYLKMGWQEVGRLPVAVMPTSWRFPLVVAGARRAAGRSPVATTMGEAPANAFADDDAIQTLLDAPAPQDGLATRRTVDYLRWRYGYAPLGYRIVRGSSVGDGLAVFRQRRRGSAVEAALCDVFVPDGDARAIAQLVRNVARRGDADYVLRMDRRVVTRDLYVRVPKVGPTLACRQLASTPVPANTLDQWALTMGDVELF